MRCDTDTDLVIVSAHGGGEGVSTAHAHPHAPAAVQPGPEEVCHPRPLLLGLGGQLPVPGLDPVLLHRQGSLNLGQSLVSVIQRTEPGVRLVTDTLCHINHQLIAIRLRTQNLYQEVQRQDSQH